jgi:hypothetical protein
MLSSAHQYRRLTVSAAWLMLLSCLTLAHGQNSCECGDPSLGTVTCEDDQEPFCVVKSGKVHGRCKSKGGRSGATLQRWVLSEALGRTVSTEELQNPLVQQSMRSGRVLLKNADGKLTWVTFRPIKEPLRSPLDDKLRKQDFEKKQDVEKKPMAINASGASDSDCEVCVLISKTTHCKKLAVKSEKELRASHAELCGSNKSCLSTPPSVKCKP